MFGGVSAEIVDMANLSVPRPLLFALLAAAAAFAAWSFTLRGHSSTASTSTPVVHTAPKATPATHPATKTATATHAASRPQAAKPVAHAAVKAQPATATLAAALEANKVVALLFYNPGAADDTAVRQELAAVPTSAGKVVKLAVPLTDLAHFSAVTNQVPVASSPTLVLINRKHQATTIVGFADRFEIAARVADALAGK
jgi:hypothetical protein